MEKGKEGQSEARRQDRQQSADRWHPESPLDLACTFLLIWLALRQFCGPVPIGWLSRWFVNTLLHPLHDQVKQCYHCLIHFCSRRCTRLKVWDPVSQKKKKKKVFWGHKRVLVINTIISSFIYILFFITILFCHITQYIKKTVNNDIMALPLSLKIKWMQDWRHNFKCVH